MDKQYIWVASHQSMDDEGAVIKASTSLLTLQTYVIKRAERAVKNLGIYEYEYFRFRERNTITVQVRHRGDPMGMVEWFTIKRVLAI
jgi:hypothetical protein